MPFHVCAGSSRLGVAAAGPLAAVRLPQGPRRGVHIPGRAAGGFRPHSRQGQLCPLGTPPGLLPGMFFTFMVTRSLRIKTVIQKEPFCPLSACTLATGAETFAAISPKLRTARGAGTGVLGRDPRNPRASTGVRPEADSHTLVKRDFHSSDKKTA